MNSKEIKEIRNLMFDNKEWKNINSSARKLYEEMSLREMIMSCFIYGDDIFTSVCINACSEYYHRPYAKEYIDILDYDRVMEIYNDQKNILIQNAELRKMFILIMRV